MRKKIIILAAAIMLATLAAPLVSKASDLPEIPTIAQMRYEYVPQAESRIFYLMNDLRQNPHRYETIINVRDEETGLPTGKTRRVTVDTVHDPAPELRANTVLQYTARYKTLYMMAYNDFGHEYEKGPYTGKDKRLYTGDWIGENIAARPSYNTSAQNSGDLIFGQWLEDEDHLAEMMDPNYEWVGICVAYSASAPTVYVLQSTMHFQGDNDGDLPWFTVELPNPLVLNGPTHTPLPTPTPKPTPTPTATVTFDIPTQTPSPTDVPDARYGWKKNAGGMWIYLLDDGSAAKGWILLRDRWYYMDTETGEMQTGWLKDKHSWYYLQAEGQMSIGWRQVEGNWYYFSNSGAMQTGWVRPHEQWFYLNPSGIMQTGWLQQRSNGSSIWYYLRTAAEADPEGAGTHVGGMATGWLQLGSNGAGLPQWYYFDASGTMATGTRAIGGKQYTFAPSGAWIR